MTSQILSLKTKKDISKRQLTSIDYHKYYIDRVLFEIAKMGRGRELAFLGYDQAIRHIKVHAIYYLKSNFQAFNFYKHPFNIYYSLAHLENVPMFSFVPPIRKRQQVVFNANFKQYFRGVDLGLDFDECCIFCEGKHQCTKHDKLTNKSICAKCPDYETNFHIMYEEVKRIKMSFSEWGLPYQLKFSGSGFHINIEYKYLKDCADIAQRIKRLSRDGSPTEVDEITLSKKLLNEFVAIFNLTTLDTSVVDIRRIWKCPYTIDIRTGNVALPLTDEQFRNFNYDMVRPENVIDTVRNRGLLERPGDSKNLRNYFENFILG